MRAQNRGTNKLREICSVCVGDTQYGLPIEHIVEIVGGTRPERVLLAPSFVGGIVHYRGDVLTAVSLRSLLGLEEYEGTPDLLVMEAENTMFALLVDKVGAVLRVSAEQREAIPSMMGNTQRRLFDGAYKLDHSLLVMLDPGEMEPMRLADAGRAVEVCAH